MSLDQHPDAHVFFLHIPKTAGSSLRLWLETHFDQDQIADPYMMHELAEIDDPAAFLSQYRFIRGHFSYSIIRQLLDHDPLTLTVLRDPVDRFISLWGFLRAYRIHDLLPKVQQYSLQQVKTMSLDDFIDAIESNQQSVNFQWQTNLLGSSITVYSPTPRFGMPDAADLACATQRLQQFAWVGLTERFSESLALLAYTFGWWPIHNEPRVNITRVRPKVADLDPTMRERILAISHIDQALYEYGCELFAQRYRAMCIDLLERYGGRDHARLEPPLSAEVVTALLKQHYAARLRRRDALALPEIRSMDAAFEGDGWYELEYTAQGEIYRWSGATRHAQIVLPVAPEQAYRATVRVIHIISITTLQHARVIVNDQPLPYTLLTEPDAMKRLEMVYSFMEGELSVLQVERKIRGRVKRQMEKT
ncbi:MAG TPA: sulfotransferase family 2 domain-containing protein, partial [Roseiflexaceae bacterium]|nr:sulfotransferase family 2 domain-containing protein [Roseiflexaceae bacterium]